MRSEAVRLDSESFPRFSFRFGSFRQYQSVVSFIPVHHEGCRLRAEGWRTELLIALRSPHPRAELSPVSSELPGKSDSDCRAGFRVDITSTTTPQGGLTTTDRPRLLSHLQWRNCRFIASWNDFGLSASLLHHSDHCITLLCLRPEIQGFNYTCEIPLITALRFNMISNHEKGKRIHVPPRVLKTMPSTKSCFFRRST